MKKDIERYHRLIDEAERFGFAGAAFEEVLATPECHQILRSELDRYIENALDDKDEYRHVFLVRIESIFEKWEAVFEEDDYLLAANELRGASVLVGWAGKMSSDGKRFDEQRWWPST